MTRALRCAGLAWALGVAGMVQGDAALADHTPPDETRCLALTLYWEAGNQGAEAMAAVAAVVLNRVRHAEFPGTVCGVIQEGGETPPCQFSWWCDGRSDAPEEDEAWRLAQKVAHEELADPAPDPTGDALFFHDATIEAPWHGERERTARIGDHVFYR